jgi:hypothetical protein
LKRNYKNYICTSRQKLIVLLFVKLILSQIPKRERKFDNILFLSKLLPIINIMFCGEDFIPFHLMKDTNLFSSAPPPLRSSACLTVSVLKIHIDISQSAASNIAM